MKINKSYFCTFELPIYPLFGELKKLRVNRIGTIITLVQ
jgi:hypothetical protein